MAWNLVNIQTVGEYLWPNFQVRLPRCGFQYLKVQGYLK